MKINAKRRGAIFAAAAVATGCAVAGSLLLTKATPVFADEKCEGETYFYDKLGSFEDAKKFYNAFETLYEGGKFKSGNLEEYNLVENGVITENDALGYIENGDKKIVEAYGAGRDSFLMDHPDLFYADVFGTSISAGSMGGKSVAFLDSSRVNTLYIGSINSSEKVEAAIAKYEAKLSEIVAGAKAAGGVKEQIEYVNQYICDNTEYSYGTELDGNKYVDTDAAAYISTSYGALVNGKAICGGYSKAFKAVMDRLDIPCVCIQGYSLKDDGDNVAHMWNTVKIDGHWYNVDVTWNDTGNVTGLEGEKWLFKGTKNFEHTHTEDNIVSSSGYELAYPGVAPYDLGVTADDNNMNISGEYSGTGTEKMLHLSVTYEGKGALKLREEGLHLAFRQGFDSDGKITWTQWISAIEVNNIAAGGWVFEDTVSHVYVAANIGYMQFALINRAPDESGGASYPNEPDKYGELAGKELKYYYNSANITDADFEVQPSTPYENDGYTKYISAPWGNPYPSNGGTYPVNATYDIRITYTEQLEKIESVNDIGMDVTSSRGNDTIKDSVVIEDLHWDGDRVITFKLTPSKMYIHDCASIYFVPTNLRGVGSKKVPDPVTYKFKSKSVVCNKILPDGRLYMNVYGAPMLVDTTDLSVTDFKDENGNYYSESQRSQLMLVVETPDKDAQKELDDTLYANTDLKEGDVKKSATYEINLNLCGVVRRVPNGSYVQVAFGFPEGIDASDAGTVFKIYHYKRGSDGKINGVEEIPVIVTQYGLIARMESFSPFTIVAMKADCTAAQTGKKTVMASVLGDGALTANGGSGIAEVDGDSIVYDVTPSDGYKVQQVLLNGKAVEPAKYESGKLTLAADDLGDSNLLEATFIKEEAAQKYAALGVEIATIETPDVTVEKPDAKPEPKPDPKPDDSADIGGSTGTTGDGAKDNTGLIVGIVIVVAALVVAAAVIALTVKFRKNKS